MAMTTMQFFKLGYILYSQNFSDKQAGFTSKFFYHSRDCFSSKIMESNVI